jgi:predicted Fe-Mo cluster-binding NifX family protein
MKVGIASTESTLSENVYRRFADAPYYLVVDSDTGQVDAIRNYCRCRSDFQGVQAAQLLADKGARLLLSGDTRPECVELLKGAGVTRLDAYPGTGLESLARLVGEAPGPSGRPSEEGTTPSVPTLQVIDGESVFTGRHIEYDDWELLLDIPTPPGASRKWLEPHDFAHGAWSQPPTRARAQAARERTVQ